MEDVDRSRNVGENQATHRTVKLDELSTFMPFFSGSPSEDVNFFINTVEQTRKTFNVEDEVMKLLVFKHLQNNAKVWLSSQEDLFTKSYLEVLNLIKTTFTFEISTFELRRKLELRKWTPEETFLDFFVAKRNLAMPLRINEAELIDYVIEGIPDRHLKNQAKMSGFSSTSSLLKAFQTIQLPKQFSSSAPVCYNCHLPGHLAAKCLKPRNHLSGSTNSGAASKWNPDDRRKFGFDRSSRIAVVKNQDTEDRTKDFECGGMVDIQLTDFKIK